MSYDATTFFKFCIFASLVELSWSLELFCSKHYVSVPKKNYDLYFSVLEEKSSNTGTAIQRE